MSGAVIDRGKMNMPAPFATENTHSRLRIPGPRSIIGKGGRDNLDLQPKARSRLSPDLDSQAVTDDPAPRPHTPLSPLWSLLFVTNKVSATGYLPPAKLQIAARFTEEYHDL